MRTIRCDVIVIGSGFGAAAPALRLAAAGAKVVIVEKGPHVDTSSFRQTSDPAYIQRYIKSTGGDRLKLTYAEAYGGGSGFYEMVSLRAPSLAFTQTEGGRPLWPDGIDRRALDPYYDIAERMLNVEQIPLAQVPRSGLMFAKFMRNLGYSCDRARYAVRGCQSSGFCVTGCIYGAKQSLFLNYLPQAKEAGATVGTDLEAQYIRPIWPAEPGTASRLSTTPTRYAVVCRRRTGNAELVRYQAKIVILAGGTVGTAALLNSSRPYLPLLSREVGRHVAYNGHVTVAGLLPDSEPDVDMFTGRTHPGMVSYEFLQSHGITVHAGKAMPLMLVSGAQLRVAGERREPWSWGAANVELMRQVRTRVLSLLAFGLTPPNGAIDFTPEGGEPEASLDLTAGVRRFHRETKTLLESILTRNGCRLIDVRPFGSNLTPQDGNEPQFSTAHQVGSCRMADSPEHGVVNVAGEVFNYPGLYISDGSVIPSSLAVNTSLTILANAERIAAGIAERYQLPAAA